MTDRPLNRAERRSIAAKHRELPEHLVEVPPTMWPVELLQEQVPRRRVWRSRFFLVQEYAEPGAPIRLSINRVRLLPNGRWADGITWDELQRVKAEVGFGEHWAVEIYPAARDLVDVANIRHLWLLTEPPSFGWRRREAAHPLD